MAIFIFVTTTTIASHPVVTPLVPVSGGFSVFSGFGAIGLVFG